MSFPEQIWDGTHTGRKESNTDSPVTLSDYRAVVSEVASVQKELLRIIDTIGILPSGDIGGEIKGVRENLDEFISGSTLVSIRTEVAKILVRVIALESAFEKFDDRWNIDVKAFQNDTINFMTSFKKELTSKVNKLTNEFSSLSNLLKG